MLISHKECTQIRNCQVPCKTIIMIMSINSKLTQVSESKWSTKWINKIRNHQLKILQSHRNRAIFRCCENPEKKIDINNLRMSLNKLSVQHNEKVLNKDIQVKWEGHLCLERVQFRNRQLKLIKRILIKFLWNLQVIIVEQVDNIVRIELHLIDRKACLALINED